MKALPTPATTLDADADRSRDVAHLVPKARLLEGYVLGKRVDAVCGTRFIPSRDPDHLPLCSGCREVAVTTYGMDAE